MQATRSPSPKLPLYMRLTDPALGLPRMIEPWIRSSDYGLSEDPLLYLLRRRLGLATWLDYGSEALNKGTWFHNVFAWDGIRPEVAQARLDSIVARAQARGLDPQPFLEQENKDMQEAAAWYAAASEVRFGKDGLTFHERLEKYRILGREVCLGSKGRPNRVVQYDLLLYDEGRREVWILDVKTTGTTPKRRLAGVRTEFQTLYYIHELVRNFARVRRHYGLPRDAKVGGMIHLAVQKPKLQMCNEDRDFLGYHSYGKGKGVEGRAVPCGPDRWEIRTWDLPRPEPFKLRASLVDTEQQAISALHALTGKKPEKEYSGEPVFANYLDRCRHWYLSTGPYLHEAGGEPKVNMSFTPVSLATDALHTAIFRKKLKRVRDLALAKPIYSNFPDGAGLVPKNYEPFYRLYPHYWASIIEEEGFRVVRREADLPDPPFIMELE